ncbi:hypothetical protein [Aeribacillus pallidus]|uniref:hypothetical protein n=1 Tax=Aeribacillus pallidus TaxID=33936 RepID=UPI003D25426D
MKKWFVGLMLVILVFCLTITKSLYVEWGELFIIIGALSLVSVIFLKNENKNLKLLGTSAIIGFIFFWIFGVADLIIDHYLYFLPNGMEDGTPLTLGLKLEEYSDDLFIGSIISTSIVLVVTFVLTKILSFASAKTV